LKVLKEKLNIALAQACMDKVIKKSSVTPYILSLWGKKDVSPKTIGKVAKALETDVTELLADSKGAAQ